MCEYSLSNTLIFSVKHITLLYRNIMLVDLLNNKITNTIFLKRQKYDTFYLCHDTLSRSMLMHKDHISIKQATNVNFE